MAPASEASTSRPSWGRRLAGIEGLRGIAAVAVIIGHVAAHLGGTAIPVGKVVGQLHHGLTLFFALSGFLLYRPFATAIIARTPKPPTGSFFRNRALRIYPAYIVILLLSNYVLQTAYRVSASESGGLGSVSGTLGTSSPGHVLIQLTMLHTFIPSTVKTGLGASWSLTTELTFYLLLPMLAAASIWVATRIRRRTVAACLTPVFLLFVGVVGKVIAQKTLKFHDANDRFFQLWGATWHAVLERSILPQADLFAYGAAAAVLFVLAEQGRLTDAQVTLLRRAAYTVSALAVLVLVTVGHLPGILGSSRWQASPIGAVAGCVILAATLKNPDGKVSPLGRVLDHRVFEYTGKISYSLYLWHLPVLWWLARHGMTLHASKADFVLNVAIVVAVSYLLSVITYHYVEKPALRLKKRTDRGQAAAGAAPARSARQPATA